MREVGYILDLGGVEFKGGRRIDSLKALLAEGHDAVFVGRAAARARPRHPRTQGSAATSTRHRLAFVGRSAT